MSCGRGGKILGGAAQPRAASGSDAEIEKCEKKRNLTFGTGHLVDFVDPIVTGQQQRSDVTPCNVSHALDIRLPCGFQRTPESTRSPPTEAVHSSLIDLNLVSTSIYSSDVVGSISGCCNVDCRVWWISRGHNHAGYAFGRPTAIVEKGRTVLCSVPGWPLWGRHAQTGC